jgi:hypothetical protein
MRLAPRRSEVRALAWFALVSVLVLGPLLGRGYLFLLDFPAGPRFPRVPLFPLPSSPFSANATPLLAVHSLLRNVYVYLPDKLFLLAPIVVGGMGVYRLLASRFELSTFPAVFGGTLFTINPFVYDRYLAGQMYFLLAYALIPWAFTPILDVLTAPSTRNSIRFALWFGLIAAIDLHVAGMYALLFALALLFAPSGRARSGLIAVGLAALLSAYWVLPSLLSQPGQAVTTADLSVYASRPSGLAVVPALVSLQGFWRNEFPTAAQRVPVLYVLLLPILGLVVVGGAHLIRPGPTRGVAAVLAVAGAAGVVLAAGTSAPVTGPIFRWLFEHVWIVRIYREPQKFLALTLLAYAVFGAVGVSRLLERWGYRARAAFRWGANATAVAAIAAVFGYSFTMFWGFLGQARLVDYPQEWEHVEQMTSDTSARLLVLPWHLYATWSFADDRIIENPAKSFFSAEVLSGDNVGFNRLPTQSTDPFSYYIQRLIADGGSIRNAGHMLAPLDVRFVLLLKEADWKTYGFLSRQADLVPVYGGSRLTLFENAAWEPGVWPLWPAGSSPPAPLPSVQARDRGSAHRLELNAPLTAPTGGTFPPVARLLPVWPRISPSSLGAPFIATGDRCTDGWRLGDQAALCQLGAIATFKDPSRTESLWRPFAGATIVGYLLSGFALLGMLLYLRWIRGRRT